MTTPSPEQPADASAKQSFFTNPKVLWAVIIFMISIGDEVKLDELEAVATGLYFNRGEGGDNFIFEAKGGKAYPNLSTDELGCVFGEIFGNMCPRILYE